MTTRHFTAWLVNVPSCLDQPFMDLTVLEDELIGGDAEDDAEWATDGSKEPAFYAITTVNALDGDDEDGQREAKELLTDAGWSIVGDWDVTDNAYVITVERDDISDEAAPTTTAWLTLDAGCLIHGQGVEVGIIDHTHDGDREVLAPVTLPLSVTAAWDNHASATQAAEKRLVELGWETAGKWDAVDTGYTVQVRRARD